jgi:hypothetical protein
VLTAGFRFRLGVIFVGLSLCGAYVVIHVRFPFGADRLCDFFTYAAYGEVCLSCFLSYPHMLISVPRQSPAVRHGITMALERMTDFGFGLWYVLDLSL